MEDEQDLVELVTDYAEGKMSFWEKLRFQMHLGMCRHCREYVRQVKITVSLAKSLPPPPPPPEVEAELLARFRSWRASG
ncbi:MAG: zf-HC2 domain-containing protein [Thermoanaerobaculum sp.]